MSQPTAVLKQTQQRLLTILAVATGALMLVAVALVPLLVSRALMPLRRVTEASTELAGGNYARRSRSHDPGRAGTAGAGLQRDGGAVQRP